MFTNSRKRPFLILKSLSTQFFVEYQIIVPLNHSPFFFCPLLTSSSCDEVFLLFFKERWNSSFRTFSPFSCGLGQITVYRISFQKELQLVHLITKGKCFFQEESWHAFSMRKTEVVKWWPAQRKQLRPRRSLNIGQCFFGKECWQLVDGFVN